MKKRLLIYVDDGVSQEAIPKFYKLFSKSDFQIKVIDSKYLKNEWLDPKIDLLLIPGGRDIPYHRKLKPLGTNNIRKFVEEGGRYLGICAGAYFASAAVEFEKGGKLEVIAKRDLGFYPSNAVGPILGLGAFDYYSEKGVLYPEIEFNQEHKKIPVYYNGGCGFLDLYPDVKIIAKYPNQIPAIICCKVSLGIAILSGVHLEYVEDSNDADYIFKTLIDYFKL